MRMTREMRNAWRRWAGKHFEGWLRLWSVEAAFKAGWRMARGEAIVRVDDDQDPEPEGA